MFLLPLHFGVLLLAVASFTCAVQDYKKPTGDTAYQQFLRQHYDNPKTPGTEYCTIMMQKKGMTNQDRPKPKCKETNSFIHTSKKQIQAVCKEAGKPYENNLRVSILPFRVTTCKIQGDASGQDCKYRGSETTRHIVIACEEGLPVHFAEGIVVPN